MCKHRLECSCCRIHRYVAAPFHIQVSKSVGNKPLQYYTCSVTEWTYLRVSSIIVEYQVRRETNNRQESGTSICREHQQRQKLWKQQNHQQQQDASSSSGNTRGDIFKLTWAQESIPRNRFRQPMQPAVLVFLNNLYGGQEPRRNRVVVPARQVTQPGGIGPLKSILGILKSLKIRALASRTTTLFLLVSWPPQIILKFQHRSKMDAKVSRHASGSSGTSNSKIAANNIRYAATGRMPQHHGRQKQALCEKQQRQLHKIINPLWIAGTKEIGKSL